MKKSLAMLYCLVMAMIVLMLSGCGGSSGGGGEASSKADNLMVITSAVLKRGESYRLYRGDRVRVISTREDYNPTYYVAPIASGQPVTINLEFAEPISGDDQPFMIVNDDDDTSVVFYYNPRGDGTRDTSTAYGDVIRSGGGTQQLRYSGLSVKGASIDLEGSSEEVVIVLNGSTASIQGGNAVPNYNYVWHADPDHRDEYYTLGDSTTELTEEEMTENITAEEGVYINRDIRYMPNTLEFSGTVKDDDETEYAAYYSSSVQAEVAAELGDGFEGPYIFATLPQSREMGQGFGGGMPPNDRRNISGAVSNSDIAAFATMTHSASEAYNNPVLHIVESGVYRLKGTWHGQIWIEVGEGEEDRVALILDGVTVSCDVAPALVFKKVYECGPDTEAEASTSWRTIGASITEKAGALVVIADGSTNNFTGANVYRMLKPAKKKDSVTKIDGTDLSQQKKRYKMDGAFYSFMSMAIGAETDNGGGKLNITSTTYEGLDSEMHLTIDSGIITVTAEDDGINVNEDDISVFTMNGGDLTITAKGGDGIDSNGWITINDGVLDITAAQDSNQTNAQAEGPLDADKEVYISDNASYTHRAYNGTSNTPIDRPDDRPEPGSNTTTQESISIPNSVGDIVMSIRYSDPASDTESSQRDIQETGNVFTLTHWVNSFSGVH